MKTFEQYMKCEGCREKGKPKQKTKYLCKIEEVKNKFRGIIKWVKD